MTNLKQRICQCWFLPVLVALLALTIASEARIVFVQLPPSPSLGLVQDPKTGKWIDPLAPYDTQGLRLWGTAENAAVYNLILKGQTAFTFTSQDSGFDLYPAGTNQVIGDYLDQAGAVGVTPLANGTPIGSDAGTHAWFSHDQASGGTLGLATARGSDTIGSPILFTGPFAGIESAFIGLKIFIKGEAHYGWVRGGAPVSINGGWVYAYAYETTPSTPIEAGQTGEPVTFEANFIGGNEVPPNKSIHSGSGTFILENSLNGYTLSYHLQLDGAFMPTSAGIYGPANSDKISIHQIASLGAGMISNLPPIVIVPFGPVVAAPQKSELNRSRQILQPPVVLVYDGQITLNSTQAAELLAGQLYVNFTTAQFRQGELRGAILPTAAVEFSATLSGRNEFSRNTSKHRGEGGFTLVGNQLSCELALDNFAFSSVGIYASPFAFQCPWNLIATLDARFGVMIPAGGFPNAPGSPGQILYTGQSILNLTDEQVYRLKRGEFYIVVPTPRFPLGEISGRIQLEQ